MVDVRDFWRVRIPPPVWFVTGVATGGALNRLWPMPVPGGTPLRLAIASFVGVASIALALSALKIFRSGEQDPLPWTESPDLYTGGPYRFTRNPMYVALAGVQGAVGLALSSGWTLILVPVVLTMVYLMAVRFEEAYLSAQFGDAYLEYKSRVRRWL